MVGGEPVALSAGARFHGRYEVVKAIRSGGMGAVYEVIHVPTNRRRALKVMLASLVHDAEMRARFELEARVTADVESEHIVETFDAGVDEETGAPFLVMELLRGQDLRAMLLERGRLSPQEVVPLLVQASLALERTHVAGIVHRDLKPDNLFVTRRDDGSARLKILDFGIAKLVAQSAQSIKTTRTLGNPCYMAPEQIRGDGDIDARADLYSVGHIAFALLVGQAYWDTEVRECGSVYPALLKIAQGAKEPATVRARAAGVELPEAFDSWFAHATALDPRDRAEDVRLLVERLARALEVKIETRTAPTPPLPLPPQAIAQVNGATGLTASLGSHAGTGSRSSFRRSAIVVAGALVAIGVVAIAGSRGQSRAARDMGEPGISPSSTAPSAQPPRVEPAAANQPPTPAAEEPPPPPAPIAPASTASSLAPVHPSIPAASHRATGTKPDPSASASTAPTAPRPPPKDPSDMR
jgi:eukaryotic-like serine/threonine-protein kinase